MAKLSIAKGSTSVLVRVFIQDSSSTTGAGLTGLAYNTASLVCYRMRDDDGNAGATAITLATATKGTWTSGGFVEKDATNAPGWYEFGIPDNALATGSRSVDIHFKGATNMAPLPVEIELTGWNNQDSVRGGMTAMPNAAAGASGGLLISGSNSGTTTLGALTVTGSLTVSDGLLVSRSTSNASAITATGNGTGHGFIATSGSGATGDGLRAVAASTNGHGFSLAGAGSGDGLKTTGGGTGHGFEIIGGGTSGDGINITTTSGHGANIAATGTSKHGITTTGGNGGTSDGLKAVAGTGGVPIRGDITGNITGALSGAVGSVTGAVGSVTGAVGSVTGNVGGNVTGSIGSLGATAKSDVNAEVLDVLNTDTFAEPGQEAPPATTTLQKKISYLYKLMRNKVTQTSTTLSIFADDASTVDQKATVSDDGTTYTRGEIASGP